MHVTDAGSALLRQRHDNRAIDLDGLLARLCAADRRRIDAALPAVARLIALDNATETP